MTKIIETKKQIAETIKRLYELEAEQAHLQNLLDMKKQEIHDFWEEKEVLFERNESYYIKKGNRVILLERLARKFILHSGELIREDV